jgi:hypothetical protein
MKDVIKVKGLTLHNVSPELWKAKILFLDLSFCESYSPGA